MRTTRLAALLAFTLAAAACGEIATTAPSDVKTARGGQPVLIAGTCTTLPALLGTAADLFGDGSPDYNSVRGKLENLAKHVSDGNEVETKAKAHDIVDFVLVKNEQNALPGEQYLEEFVNEVYCFAGLDITMTDGDNSHLIFPSDLEQVVYSADAQAAVRFPSFPVNAPTLITFANEPSAPLNTKLDQYPGYFSITAQADAETILTQPATVGVCAQGVIPADVRARLRLGHGLKVAETATDYQGFEITPAAEADFLQCANEVAVAPSTVAGRFWARVASLVLPRPAFARQEMAFGGGVGGTVTEFSPFAPIDPQLSFGGGVGGTVTEFSRSVDAKSLLLSEAALASCTAKQIEAPYGSPVPAHCLPLVRVRTRNGTALENVPVQWGVTLGGGTIGVRTEAACGALGATASDVTDAVGVSDICWTLGAIGANQVSASPGIGGDAPAGVFFAPAVQTFDATANPPSAMAFITQPASTIAGAPFGAQVEVRDRNGDRVIGYTGSVTLGVATGPVGGALGGTVTVDAVEGVATFDALVITKAGAYTLSASAPYLPGPADLPVSASFSIAPAAAASMAIVQGNNQVAAAGATLPIAPTVFVSDMYGNAISGLSVEWTPALSSTASVSPGTSTTASDGQAGTSWTVGDGANELRAELTSNPAIFVLFAATGTSTLVDLNYCAPGGSSDPVNDPSKPFAFHIPDPGNGKTVRQVQLFFSSQGRANASTEYRVNLRIQRGTFDPVAGAATAQVATALVNLRGNNSENKMITFALPTPLVGTGGRDALPITVTMSVPENPDGAVLTFNTGPCSPGKNCKIPPSCKATEVSSPLPYPLGTEYRKSVGLRVRGTN